MITVYKAFVEHNTVIFFRKPHLEDKSTFFFTEIQSSQNVADHFGRNLLTLDVTHLAGSRCTTLFTLGVTSSSYTNLTGSSESSFFIILVTSSKNVI